MKSAVARTRLPASLLSLALILVASSAVASVVPAR